MQYFKALTTTLSSLAWSYPFWATLFYEQLKLVITEAVPTLAVGGGKMLINQSYFEDEKFNDNHRIFMIAHEVSHEMFFHPAMMKQYLLSGVDGEPFDMQRFNMAADYMINDMLIQLGVGEYHSDWLHSPHIKHDDGNVMDVYRRLKPKNPPPQGGGGDEGESDAGDSPPSQQQGGPGQGGGAGGKNGNNQPKQPTGNNEGNHPSQQPQQYDILDKDGNKVDETPQGKGTQDQHNFEDGSPYDEMDWKQAVAAAHQAAKTQGHGNSVLDRIIEEYIETKINWKQQLRDFVTVSRGREQLDWKRSHKRKMHERGIFVPTKLSYKMGEVLIVDDVSGSVSDGEQAAFKSAITEIFTDCTPKKMRILCVATSVLYDDEYDTVEDFAAEWEPRGSGGTDMQAGFRHSIEEQFLPEVAIVLTDGYTYTDIADEPPFPVVWVTTGAEDLEYGRVIKMELE